MFQLAAQVTLFRQKTCMILVPTSNLVFKSFKQNIKETRLLLHHTSTIYAIKTTTSNVIQTFFLSPTISVDK